MAETTLKVEGMSCQHCVMSVMKAIDSVEGVKSSEVSVGNVKVLFDESRISRDDVVNAIEKSGYKVA
jgi:copper chaperone